MIFGLSLLLAILYTALFYVSIKHRSIIPILPLFLITFGLSLVSRPMLGLIFEDFDVGFGTWIYWGSAPPEFVIKSLILLIIFSLATISTLLINTKTRRASYNSIQRNSILNNVSIAILVATFPIYIYRGFTIWRGINDEGYLATYTGDVKAPLWMNIGMAFFQVSYYFFIASHPRKSEFIKVSLLFLIGISSSLGTGQRGEFVTTVLFILFISQYFQFYKPSFITYIFIGLTLSTISVVVDALRFGNTSIQSMIFGLSNFVWGQGVSFFTIVGALEHSNEFWIFEGLMFPNKLFSCDIAPLFTGSFCNNSITVVNTPGIWWQKLSYILDPQKFEEGGGLGGSIISSLYLMFNFQNFSFSCILFFITTLIFWKFVRHVHHWTAGNVFVQFYAFYTLHALIFMPRAALDYLIPHPRIFISAIIIVLIYLLVRLFSSGRHIRGLVTTESVV